jgi:hypothetical protein
VGEGVSIRMLLVVGEVVAVVGSRRTVVEVVRSSVVARSSVEEAYTDVSTIIVIAGQYLLIVIVLRWILRWSAVTTLITSTWISGHCVSDSLPVDYVFCFVARVDIRHQRMESLKSVSRNFVSSYSSLDSVS